MILRKKKDPSLWLIGKTMEGSHHILRSFANVNPESHSSAYEMCPLRDLLMIETNFNTIKIASIEKLLWLIPSVNCIRVGPFHGFLLCTEGFAQQLQALEVVIILKITTLDTTSTKGSHFCRTGQFHRRSSHVDRNCNLW